MPNELSTTTLTEEERERVRPLLEEALARPEQDLTALREVVRQIAHRARDEGEPVTDLLRALEAELRAVASDETRYFDYDQVRERMTLWSHTAYRGR